VVYQCVRNMFYLCFLLVLLVTTNAIAKEPRQGSKPAYTVYEGQLYRWNNHVKKYIPMTSPYQRAQEAHLKRQLGSMGRMATPSSPTRIKWWEL
jgi:hypothetical protein